MIKTNKLAESTKKLAEILFLGSMMPKLCNSLLLGVVLFAFGLRVAGPDGQIIMYWDNIHSFTDSEHSLSRWLEGKTASAIINSIGEIELSFDFSGFPHVLTSPELNIDCESFDALRITYSNQLKYSPFDNVRIAVAWIDEVAAQRSLSDKALNSDDIKGLSAIPIETSALAVQVLKFDDNKNWRKGTKVNNIALSIASDRDTMEGKFIIRSIELINMSD